MKNIVFEYEKHNKETWKKAQKEYIEIYTEIDKKLYDYLWFNNIDIKGINFPFCIDTIDNKICGFWSVPINENYSIKDYNKTIKDTIKKLSSIFSKYAKII